ncbi:MAG: 2-oxo acid dehydrogenase subunit E2 [Planctomycetota bacterium]|jgi:pyruvate dehydrogenase E2 component (dihydrolipoamide acetyltransferase)
MHIIRYPKKGRFSSEGVVTAWDKNEGDPVQKGDFLVQIESAGECIQLESAADGALLKMLAKTGQVVGTGDPLAVIGQSGEDISKALRQLEQKKRAVEKASPKASPKPKSKPAVEIQTVQPTQSKKEEVMATPKSTGSSDNVIPILMPQAGQSMEEGTILSWKIKEGDTIEVGQVIMEIETDKATMEVEADAAGRVAKIVSGVGDIVKVKMPVAFLAENDADVDAHLAVTDSPAPAAKPASVPVTPEAKTVPTPAVPAAAAKTPPAQPADSNSEGGVIPILMPQAGQSMEEGTILSWKIKEGDQVEVGQIIMEMETDKATMEVEAVDAGRIAKIVAAEGDIVGVKVPVAYLAEEGVDVDALVPSAGGSPAPVAAQGEAKPAPSESVASSGENADVIPAGSQVHTLSKMRRAIGNNLLYSKQNIPHFYAKVTIDAGLLLTRACAKTISQYPTFRSQYKDTELIENPSTNIGIAVGTDEGLTVPVVIGADQMNLEQLAARTREIVESARNGKLEGMGQGVFTITNLGMFGVEEFSAIINPPESAILAVGAIREGVVVENGAVRPTRLMTVTLSVDHRVIDGVLAAQFLKTFKELLESPEQLIS